MCGTEGNCKVDKFQYVEQLENFQFVGASPCRQTRKLALTRCRGVRRIVHCLNMLLRVQAPDEQYLATVQHGSLLRANFQAFGESEHTQEFEVYGEIMI